MLHLGWHAIVCRRVAPSIKFAVWREAHERATTTQCPRPGLNPRPLDREASPPTMRLACPHQTTELHSKGAYNASSSNRYPDLKLRGRG